MNPPRRDRDGKAKVETARPKLDRNQVETLIAITMRSLRVRTQAVRTITDKHFHADERTFALLMRVIAAIAPKYDDVEQIPYLDLCNAVTTAVNARGEGFSDDERDDLLHPSEGLLNHVYKNITDNQYTITDVLEQLKIFLHERGVDRPVKQAALFAGNGTVVTNFAAMIAAGQAVVDSVATSAEGVRSTFAILKARGVEASVQVIPTGLSFVDDYLNGGIAAGEVYGLTAGTGFGKSTLVHQLAVSMTRTFQGMVGINGRARRVDVFSYEEMDKDIRNRTMPFAAQIRRDRWEKITDEETELSRVLLPYDLELARREGRDPNTYPTEYERYTKAFAQLNRNYGWIDMTINHRGDGGVDELMGMMAELYDDQPEPPGLIIIDSGDLLAMNWLNIEFGPVNAVKLFPTQFPSIVHQLRKRLAVRYGCGLWINNQFSGAVQKRAPGTMLHHSDGAGSKSWANHLTAAMSLGAQSEDKVAVLNWTKSRRGGHEGKYSLIKLDGAFSRWVDVSDKYTIHNGELVRKDVVTQVHGPVQTRKAKKSTAEFFNDTDDLGLGGA